MRLRHGYFAVAGNAASASWGDFLGAGMHQRYPTTYVAAGYVMNGSTVVPYYFWFGREGSNPNKPAPKPDAGDTLSTALVTTLNPDGGSYSYSNALWNPANGRKDVDIYRFKANAGTYLYALTSSTLFQGGDDVDTMLRLFNASGTELAFNDNISSNNNYSYLEYRFNATGTYYIGVSGAPNKSYNPNSGGSGVVGDYGDYQLSLFLVPVTTTSFKVTTTAANPDVAGTPFSVTVTALDSKGGVNTGYRGTVHFSSLDTQATLPANYTFTAADNGTHTFTDGVALKKAGLEFVTVNDTTFTYVTGVSPYIYVVPTKTSTLTVTGFPSPTQAGEFGYFLVTTQDPYGNLTPLYNAKVHFTSSDPQALLPLDYTFIPLLDPGFHVFVGLFRTAGTQTLTATDIADASITGTQSDIDVTPAPADHFQVDAPGEAPSGSPFDVTVTARDRFGNVDTTYHGTVTWTSTDPDPGAALPDDYLFTADDNGVHTFAGGVTLITPDDQTVTVTDVDTGAAGSATVTVTVPEGGPGIPVGTGHPA